LSGILLEPATNTVTRKDRWQLSWQDLFNEPTLNSEHWNVDIWPPGKVNNEDQAYTDDERNLRIENGMLVLEAHRDRNNEPAFTSSRIHTRGKHDFLFGRVEVIARLPDAQGTWPAIWLLPSDPFKYASNCEAGVDWQGNRECDAWPNSGEIDLMEHVGFESGHIHGTVHTAANYWVNGQQRKGRLIQPTATQDFHVYALEWRPDRIDIFVDETRYFSYHRHESDSWQAWPFDQPFHLIINLAVGGNWGRAGGPIAEDKFPQTMLIDSVRVYQLAQ
jgi:beta-glucanase (GH16 family)